MKNIGFIGVGMMGQGMAHNLVIKGFNVTVMGNRNRKPVEELVAEGAREASSLQDLVTNVDAIILCVTGSPQVEDLIFRAGGILENCRSGQILIDCSTSEPMSSARIAGQLATKGVSFVDAPLARTPVEAMQGRLNTMVGADDATFAKVKPILEAFCENIFHIGGTTSAQKLKLLNNFVAIGTATLATEALAMCDAVGVDQRKFFDVISKGGANSGIFQMIAGGILEGRSDGMKFSIANAGKDLSYYNNMTAAFANPSMIGPHVAATLQQSAKEGYGEQMLGAMVQAHKDRLAKK
ncbi:NAD(P)-dependent oxidoreductase [Herbaspirillum lusitanum]|uniref:NAD(P)-dependent oxidoreductase n=1 Tax=Herbaspirillum lusitanum TaxID=213312 RepID=UPI0022381A15|nr:NAD(P)-dependent oxidoreductase [Herbaspirillum lusitanum]MCW5300258.1 NAD(P)-dependent oxidoreductase [Herbaspirillum lusitanum]